MDEDINTNVAIIEKTAGWVLDRDWFPLTRQGLSEMDSTGQLGGPGIYDIGLEFSFSQIQGAGGPARPAKSPVRQRGLRPTTLSDERPSNGKAQYHNAWTCPHSAPAVKVLILFRMDTRRGKRHHE